MPGQTRDNSISTRLRYRPGLRERAAYFKKFEAKHCQCEDDERQ
jgi:hypothetical protein